jgi:hypothetical protein
MCAADTGKRVGGLRRGGALRARRLLLEFERLYRSRSKRPSDVCGVYLCLSPGNTLNPFFFVSEEGCEWQTYTSSQSG